jgi:hypothetical protein
MPLTSKYISFKKLTVFVYIYPRNERKFGNDVRMAGESEASTSVNHIRYVSAGLESQIPHYREDGQTSQKCGG